MVLREQWRAIGTATLLFVLAAIAFRWTHGKMPHWAIDDAAITYGAALDLVDHGSLGAYVEGPPVEGYSNPIVFFVAALLHLVGVFDPITTHAWLEPLLFGLMALLLYAVLRPNAGTWIALGATAVFVVSELATPSTWLWYASGLENVWVSTGLVALLWLCARSYRGVALHPAWGIVPFLVAITRPEGPVYVAAFYGALVVFARPTDLAMRAHVRRVVLMWLVTSALYIAFLLWRRVAYGEWWPNTYYAKLGGGSQPLTNVTEYLPDVLAFSWAGAFAASVVVLAWLRDRIGLVVATLLVASLTLPITAGEDWMGWHRFCTPFFAMAHVAYATLAAALLVRASSWRRGLVGAALLVLPVVVVVGKPQYRRTRLPINARDVTITAIARWEGALRWEQQQRAGVPNAVVMMPDAGGTSLIGGMQLLDNGALTDFQQARIRDPRLVSQYHHQERRPDLVRHDEFFPHDAAYLRAHYVEGDTMTPNISGAPTTFWIRRDLVEVTGVDPTAPLVYEDAQLRVHLSDETVPFAAPRGLVRCELLVEWRGPVDEAARITAFVEGGDRDELSLRPYATGTIQRRALLLGAPDRAGSFAVSFEIARTTGVRRVERALTLEVSAEAAAIERAAQRVIDTGTTERVMRRFGRLREQLVPRLGLTAFRAAVAALAKAHTTSARAGGSLIRQLRRNASLAAHRDLPTAVLLIESAFVRRYLASCGADDRVLCIGRRVDALRRFGYFSALSHAPEVAAELATARASLASLSPLDRYRLLVGLTLATPADLKLQRALLAHRAALVATLPALP